MVATTKLHRFLGPQNRCRNFDWSWWKLEASMAACRCTRQVANTCLAYRVQKSRICGNQRCKTVKLSNLCGHISPTIAISSALDHCGHVSPTIAISSALDQSCPWSSCLLDQHPTKRSVSCKPMHNSLVSRQLRVCQPAQDKLQTASATSFS